MDDGRAYGRNAGTWDRELTDVAAGTPAGELLRRYWHPQIPLAETLASLEP